MRVAIAGVVACAVFVGCGGGDGGNKLTPGATVSDTVSATITPTATPPDARTIIELSDEAMNSLSGVRTDVSGGSGPFTVLYEAPERSQAGSAPGDWYRCVDGSLVWKRQFADDAGWGPWVLSEETVGPLRWPEFDRSLGKPWSDAEKEVLGAESVTEFRLVGETDLNGERVWVVDYDFKAPTVEGPVPVSVTEWISIESYWLLKVEAWQDDPLGFTGTTTTVYSRHNEPQNIECPVPSDDGVGGG